MKKQFLAAICGLSVCAAAHAENKLLPADAYDIKSTAGFAVEQALFVVGNPKSEKGEGYLVPVSVAGSVKCWVEVEPNTNVDPDLPPLRWKVKKTDCSK